MSDLIPFPLPEESQRKLIQLAAAAALVRSDDAAHQKAVNRIDAFASRLRDVLGVPCDRPEFYSLREKS